MIGSDPLKALEPLHRPSVADTVFDELHRQILSLKLPPGTKMSEVDVSKAFGVSRQPVRDAFYRLSKMGFLLIRPQRATMVSKISEAAVFQAQFIRSAIEAETVRAACERLASTDFDCLDGLVENQHEAARKGEAVRFHELDDRFHKEICERAGLGFAWEIIRETKAHMDRVRFLSLSFSSKDALEDHTALVRAIKARDSAKAMALMHIHLSRIKDLIPRIREDYSSFFSGEAHSET